MYVPIIDSRGVFMFISFGVVLILIHVVCRFVTVSLEINSYHNGFENLLVVLIYSVTAENSTVFNFTGRSGSPYKKVTAFLLILISNVLNILRFSLNNGHSKR